MLSKGLEEENQNIAIDLKDVPITPAYINQIKSISGITVMAKSKWMNALHIRGNQSVINSLKVHFVNKVDFANKTLNQVGKTAKVFKQKNKLRLERLKLIMLMDLPIIKLRCFTATYCISRITLELIR
jgi:hypothetical protein